MEGSTTVTGFPLAPALRWVIFQTGILNNVKNLETLNEYGWKVSAELIDQSLYLKSAFRLLQIYMISSKKLFIITSQPAQIQSVTEP